VFYTTNANESLNCDIPKAIKKPKVLLTDDSAKKRLNLTVMSATEERTKRVRNKKTAFNRYMIASAGRLNDYD
jgi:putative transposase